MLFHLRKKLKRNVVRILLRYVHFLTHRNILVLFSVLAITLAAFFFTIKLFQNVRTDFATLLPDKERSVRHLRYIQSRVGGVGTLFITISSPDFTANKNIVNSLAERFRRLPPDLIKDFQYSTTQVEKFYRDYGLYYMETSDLERLRDLLRERMYQARLSMTKMLLEDTSKSIDAEIKSIVQKYTDKNPYSHFPEGYMGNKDGTILIMMLRPVGTTDDMGFAKRLVDAVENIFKDVKPESFHKDMELGMTGTYYGILENFSSIIMDAVSTAGLTIGLVVLAIYIYYRSFRMVVVLSMAILTGILWTFAATYFSIGYLNQQTAFLGSIIVGNGINFGLIQMARYLEERVKGVNVRRSMVRSVINTMSGTMMAALTAAIAYGLLSMTNFRGFSQFGFIGGAGMVLCWAASYILLPPLLILSEKLKPLDVHHLRKKRKHPFSGLVSSLVVRYHKPILMSLIVVVPAAVVLSARYMTHDQFEYDAKKLGNRTALDKGHDLYFNQKLFAVVGNTSSPAVMIARTREEADYYARLKMDEMKKASETGKPLSIETIQWMDSIFPANQTQKAEIIREMRTIFPQKYLNLLPEKDKIWAADALRLISRDPFTEKDMPPIMLAGFSEIDGTMGRIVFFSATNNISVTNVRDLIIFGGDVERNLPVDNDEVRFASESMIFSDIVRSIAKEGPTITILSFLLIGILIFLWSSKIKDFLNVYFFMTFGMLVFVAILEAGHLKLNFFNFVVIPITIGIGIDYGINIYSRYALEGRGSIGHVIKQTGGAVGLCSFTTMVGYGTMVIANNLSMASFGLMAMVGEIVLLFFAMVYMTAWLEYRDRASEKMKIK